MNPQDRKFIIAYDFLNPNQSMLLSRELTDVPEEALSKIDVRRFIGQGIWICEAAIIELLQDAEDLSCEIATDGNSIVFEVKEILKCFPVIEGKVEPGIYEFYQSEGDYYEIKDALALSEFFDEEPNFQYENEKFICRPDGIGLYSIEEGKEVFFYQRHPLTFFDIYCPLCQQKVMTYETESYLFRCQPSSLSCPHYIGYAGWVFTGYETEELNELNINYKLVGDNLYFETSKGWQKPIIYTPSYDPVNSYWNGFLDESNFASHFFFMESEPKFWIK